MSLALAFEPVNSKSLARRASDLGLTTEGGVKPHVRLAFEGVDRHWARPNSDVTIQHLCARVTCQSERMERDCALCGSPLACVLCHDPPLPALAGLVARGVARARKRVR